MATAVTPETVEKTVYRGASAVRRRRVRRSRATPRSRTSTSTRSTSPSSRRSSRTSTASQLKGDDVGKIKTVGDAIDLVVSRAGMSREVVITGVGAVTPLGVGARTLHERWSAGVVGHRGRRGRRDRVRARPSTSRSRRRAARTASRSSRWSPRDEALRRGRLGRTSCPTTPTGSARIIGTGIGGIGTLERGKELLIEKGPKKVSPLSVPLMMGNAAAGRRVDAPRAARPVATAIVSACAAGADAIGAAARMIESGDADAVVTGGSEAALTPLASAAFARARRAVDKGISRPFDARRDGFVMGEGAGVLVLEDGEKAARARRDDPRHAARLRRHRRTRTT